jgi:hypothetical protein
LNNEKLTHDCTLKFSAYLFLPEVSGLIEARAQGAPKNKGSKEKKTS